MKKYLNYIIGGAVVVAVVLVIVFAKNRPESLKNEQNKQDEGVATTEKAVSSTPTSTETSVQKTVTPKVTAPAPKPAVSKPAPQSYTDAIEKYKSSGYYIQFYPCQATPGSLIVKQGSKIMLDNRDSKAHSIGIKNDKYLIASYGYAIATLNVIGTNYVTCDGGGSATINVVP